MKGKVISIDRYSGRGIIEPIEEHYRYAIKIKEPPGETTLKPCDYVEFELKEIKNYGMFAIGIYKISYDSVKDIIKKPKKIIDDGLEYDSGVK